MQRGSLKAFKQSQINELFLNISTFDDQIQDHVHIFPFITELLYLINATEFK